MKTRSCKKRLLSVLILFILTLSAVLPAGCRSAGSTENSADHFSPDSSGTRAAAEEAAVPGQVPASGEVEEGLFRAGLVEDMDTILACVRGMVSQDVSVVFDPTLVRGMSYYTGPIFEISMDEYGGSVGGGGRYDEMIGKFTGQQTPAVGFSIGFERIVMLLLEKDWQIPDAAPRKAYLLDKKLSDEKMREVVRQAMAERASGRVVDLEVMKKNKRFQKDQLTAEGYGEIVEVYEN